MQKNLSRLPRNVWVMSATSLFNLIPFFLANIFGVRTALMALLAGFLFARFVR